MISVFPLVFCACSVLPQLGQDIEEIATDNAIKIEIQKEAMLNHEANLDVHVKVNNSQESTK